MLVEHRLGHPGRLGDLLHRRIVEAPGGELLEGHVEQLAAADRRRQSLPQLTDPRLDAIILSVSATTSPDAGPPSRGETGAPGGSHPAAPITSAIRPGRSDRLKMGARHLPVVVDQLRVGLGQPGPKGLGPVGVEPSEPERPQLCRHRVGPHGDGAAEQRRFYRRVPEALPGRGEHHSVAAA